MRWILRIVGGLVLLLVVVVVGIGFYLNEVIGGAIERGGTYALGVPTRVSTVLLRPVAGTLRIGNLRIANPPGFDADDFLRIGEGSLALDPASLRQPTIEVRSLRFADVELALEKSKGGTNYGAILANMKRSDDAGGAPSAGKPDSEAGGGPSLIVRELLIENVLAHYDVAGGLGSVEVTIPEVRLTDIGGKKDPVSTAELTHMVVRALLASVARYGVNLPVDLVKGLGSGLGRLGSAGFELSGKVGSTVVEGGASLAGAGAKGAETAVKGAGSAAKAVTSEAGKAVGAIGGLFGGGDEEKK